MEPAEIKAGIAQVMAEKQRSSRLPTEELLAQVDHAEAEVRRRAVEGLRAQPRSPEGDPHLAAALVRALNDPVIAVRAAAGFALGCRAEPEGMDALLHAYRHDPTAYVRRLCGSMLGWAEHPGVVPAARDALRDSDRLTVVGACSVLHHKRAAEAIPDLMGLLEHPEPSVRRAACETLLVVGHRDQRILRTLEGLVDNPEILEQDAFSAAITEPFQEGMREAWDAEMDGEEPPDDLLEPMPPHQSIHDLLEEARRLHAQGASLEEGELSP